MNWEFCFVGICLAKLCVPNLPAIVNKKNLKLGTLNSSTSNRDQKQILLTVCNNSALLSVFDFALKGEVPVACYSFLSLREEVYLSLVGCHATG